MGAFRSFVLVVLVAGCGRLGFDPDRELQGPEAPEVQGDAETANFVFVTSTTHHPSEFAENVLAADQICADRAAAASLPGTYRAWLSSATTNAIDRLAGARGWIRTDGRPVVDRVTDLLAGALHYPIRIDELGEDVGTTGPLVATATNDDGLPSDRRCQLDQTSSSIYIRAGAPWRTTVGWTDDDGDAHPCDVRRRLYCFGVDHDVPLVPEREVGRTAFVTTQLFTAGGGLAAADQLCRDDARAAGVPNPDAFLALLATMTESAHSRFDLTGAPWVRLDGVMLAPSPLAFMSGLLDAPLNLTSLRTHLATRVTTGGDPLVPESNTCADWTTTSENVGTGISSITSADHFDDGRYSCATPRPIYCLGQ